MNNASFPVAVSRRDRKAGNIRPLLATIATLLLGAGAQAQTTGFSQTAGGTYDYNDPLNWVGGVINGIWDSSLTITGTQTATFAADTVLSGGLDFSYVGGFNVTLRGTGEARTITLNGDILVNTSSDTRDITIGNTGATQALNVDLGGETRAFTAGSGRELIFVNVLSNGGVIARGGAIHYSSANTYSGPTIVANGNFNLNGPSGSAANSDFFVNGAVTGSNAALIFNSNTSGTTGTTRAKSVTLNGAGDTDGAVLIVNGNSGASSVDSIAQALTAAGGYNLISLSANAAQNLQLVAGSFARDSGAVVFIRGTNLGTAPIASAATGVANLHFTAVPALSGSGTAGTSTVGILKGAFGDVVSNSNGKASSLLTYDAATGVRMLAAGEYKSTISDGQTQLDNVLFARESGGANQDVHLTAPATSINSLSFKITGAGTDSGVTISGDPGTKLVIDSGMIHASQTVTTANVTDAMVINVPTLDLNGQEGVFIAFNNSFNQGNTPAPLQINSVIANDGGNGVTIGSVGSGGQVIFGGSEANTYTGVTTVNSGILRLNKSAGQNIGLTTDLVMNGGSLTKNSNAIADTANVTINGGSFVMDSSFSSGNNGHQETINNFTMNGGSFVNHGHSAAFTVNGNATLNGSQLGMNAGGDITVLGTTTLNGGHLLTREAQNATNSVALTSLNDVVIFNQPEGEYTAATVNGHATNFGGRLALNGSLTFHGNATNANPVRIASSDTALANQGVIVLNGTRAFNIGNGAADRDLVVVPALTDDGITAGGLTKSGAGTLELLGASSYLGPTSVTAGRLVVNGSIAGSATTLSGAGLLSGGGSVAELIVSDGGTLAPGDGVGKLTAAQAVFENGGTLELELKKDASGSAGVAWDQLVIAGFLDMAQLSPGAFTLSLATFAGDTSTFDPNADHLWTSVIAPDFGVDGFFADRFVFDTSAFDAALNGTFSLVQNGDNLDLQYSAVPEPASAAFLLGGLALLAGRRGNRGRQASRTH